ncbi:protein ANTAGONIST OF LIKE HETEROCHROMATIN PROTEIN 1-like [Zerene cesonia]|uniref:protein ANTAGONIST OF LIKE HETEROCHROMATIN PROTEIN 1-like n=1 Tax=Zerene cesonia TaxID=33412 RepID=UPI0018E59A61|nr:protein ANTAGONIST OF LIKE HETEROCHROMATIN PROTEIN 1-like [Zerene cesonia]
MAFDKEFIMELFLEDNVSSVNRVIIAAANVIKEDHENITRINDIVRNECAIQVKQHDNNTLYRDTQITYEDNKFYENIVVNYTDEDYAAKFMMKKSTVQALINHLKDYIKPGACIIPLDKKVHIFLWLLTSDSSFNDVAKLFSLHKSSVSYIFHEIATLLSEQRYHFINWPSLEEQHVTRIKVNSRYGFPNCVGFIDACRLKVGSKLNRKNKPEIILLQAVCDETLMFFDIHIGEIGNTHKSRVYKDSQLAHELKNFIDFDNHILGNSEYKLKKNLITPFTSDEVLTSEEMKFNEIHWKTCTYIGHAFELLKERFKKLNHIDINKAESIKTLICAACILHNFVLLHEGSSYMKEEAVINDDGVTIDPSIVKTALEKRQFLCNYINYIDDS